MSEWAPEYCMTCEEGVGSFGIYHNTSHNICSREKAIVMKKEQIAHLFSDITTTLIPKYTNDINQSNDIIMQAKQQRSHAFKRIEQFSELYKRYKETPNDPSQYEKILKSLHQYCNQ